MSNAEREAVEKFLFSIASISGILACYIDSDGTEYEKWAYYGAQQTRDALKEAQERFIKETNWFAEEEKK